MKKFNINEYIYIQITEQGWIHLRQTVGQAYIDAYIKPREVVVKNEKWYRLQFHEVFSRLPIQSNLFFNTTVMFDEYLLKTESKNTTINDPVKIYWNLIDNKYNLIEIDCVVGLKDYPFRSYVIPKEVHFVDPNKSWVLKLACKIHKLFYKN